MSSIIKPLTALLLGAAILQMGIGLLGALVPVRASAEDFSSLTLGLLGSSYFAGLMAGCVLCPRIVTRVGHIRSFAAFTAVATAATLIHALLPLPAVWLVLRVVTGLCFAGLFTIIESWLNAVATSDNRGRILGGYTFLNLVCVSAGIQLIGLVPPTGFELFSIVAILLALAAVPLSVQRSPAPDPPRQARLHLGWLIAISPAAVVGCFGAGFVNGAFWTFAPIFAESSGLDLSQVALFMMCVMVGGAVAQWPIGLLSDRVERRWVLIGVCLIAGAAGLLLARSGGAGPSVLLAMSAAYGAAALSVWSISVAHANDLVPRRRALAVSSGLLLTFSVGAVAGPLVASVVMSRFGDAALFYHTAGSHAAIAAAVAVRMLVRPSRKDAPREVFVPVPGTTPAAFELDPRAEPGGADAGATRDALARTG